LIKDMVTEAGANVRASFNDALRQAAVAVGPQPEREGGRCKPCRGVGVLADGSFCTCQLGIDLARQDRRRAQSQTENKNPAETGPKEKARVAEIKPHGS
jgi:hypothetical protein